MSNLPEEVLSQLWGQMGDIKSWSVFMKTVMGQRGLKEKMDVLTVDYLVREAYDLKKINVQFPDSPGSLYQVLQDRMSQSQL